MKRALVGILTLAACSVAFSSVMADVICPSVSDEGGDGNLGKAKIALHAKVFNTLKACTNAAPATMACSDDGTSTAVTSWPVATRASVYVVVLDIPTAIGTKGSTFGLDFTAYSGGSGLYIASFNNCYDLSFPSNAPAFPSQPTSGTIVTSATCRGIVADATDPEGEAISVLGWLDVTAYSGGPLAVTPRLYLPDPDFQVSDCSASSSNPCYPSSAGVVGFGTAPGYHPCWEVVVVGTEPTTWSKLKQGVGSGE